MLRQAAITQYRKYPKLFRLIIEDKGSGIGLIQDLKQDGIYAKAFRPETDKVTRMASETPAIEGGNVYLPTKAPWLDDYLHELSRFPNGKHDDQVDSTSQALNVMTKSKIIIPRIRAL
jgi:predicted phage terminase large subunit-like protein